MPIGEICLGVGLVLLVTVFFFVLAALYSSVGKRFGRLKTDLGFGKQHVFHSIRKTVVTILENTGVPENVVADIVSHEKTTMTYGLYSGGLSLVVKHEGLNKLAY